MQKKIAFVYKKHLFKIFHFFFLTEINKSRQKKKFYWLCTILYSLQNILTFLFRIFLLLKSRFSVTLKLGLLRHVSVTRVLIISHFFTLDIF